MQDDISEIFDGLNQNSYTYEDVDSFVFLDSCDSIASKVSSFQDVIVEWYLFDSSEEKDIKGFLKAENLDDVFTESEFMDLICGKAYLDDDLVHLVHLKLPFRITFERLQCLNIANKNLATRLIKKSGIGDKIMDLIRCRGEAHAQERRIKNRKYRATHRDIINSGKRRYYAGHSDEINFKRKIYYRTHKKEEAERTSRYRRLHPEKRRAWNRGYYMRHGEELRLKARIKWHLHRDENIERKRKYRKEHPEVAQRYYLLNRENLLAKRKAWYELHKSEILAKKKERYNENKEHFAAINKKCYAAHSKEYAAKSYEALKHRRKRAKAARNVCAVAIFLEQLKKNNEEQYLKIYGKYQDPVTNMKNVCAALQNMDFSLCPLANSAVSDKSSQEKCGCPKVFQIPGAKFGINELVQKLKQKLK